MGQAESSGYASADSSAPKERRKKSSASTTSTTSRTPRRKELLTLRQRKILQRSWNKSQRTGLDNIGAHIFLKIYAKDSSVGYLFNLGNCPHSELKYRKFFQDHAMTFTRSLDFVMNHLDDLERVSKFCVELGKTHVKFMRRGFKTSFWDIFAEALTECAIDWEGGLRCRDVLNGWRTLVSFVIEEMRKGFEKERRRVAAEETVQAARAQTAASFEQRLQTPSPPRHTQRFSPLTERANTDFQRFAAVARCPYSYRASHEQLYSEHYY
uniref:GLOBIN domain-containing protein n=1 Tax=Steinernema glaseri TaxID=37863 RepID=A0A1I7YD88_9BILA